MSFEIYQTIVDPKTKRKWIVCMENADSNRPLDQHPAYKNDKSCVTTIQANDAKELKRAIENSFLTLGYDYQNLLEILTKHGWIVKIEKQEEIPALPYHIEIKHPNPESFKKTVKYQIGGIESAINVSVSSKVACAWVHGKTMKHALSCATRFFAGDFPEYFK